MTTETERVINMDTVAELIKAAGFYAYVEQTGGGVATIYAYRASEHAAGEPDVMAGPGSYDWSGKEFSKGYPEDFSVGRSSVDAATAEWGDEYSTDITHVGGADDEQDIANIIIAQLRAATEQYGERGE